MKQTKGHGSKSDRKKEEAIVALLTHRNVEEAARAVGIGTTTLQRWLKDPDFEVKYRKARRAAFLQAIARLQQGSGAAASTLLKIMVDPLAPASVRVRAADRVLDHSRSGMEIEDKDARVVDPKNTPAPRKGDHSGSGIDIVERLHGIRQRMRSADQQAAATPAVIATPGATEITEA